MNLTQIKGTEKHTAPQYWRSLAERTGTSEVIARLEGEFGAHVEELSPASRRQIMKLMAASFGMAGLVACRRPEEKILPVSKAVEDIVPGKPTFYSSAITVRGVANGVQVEVHDGRPTKIEGNPMHPASQGAASAFVQASVLSLYDPDRARKVEHAGGPVEWAAFDKECAEHCAQMGIGTGFRILSERTSSPTLLNLKAALLKKYPSAKWVEYDAIDAGHGLAAAEMVFGQRLQAHYHFDKADVILSLDDDFLSLDAPSTLPLKQYSRKRKVTNPGDPMNRLYVVEGQFSVTGGMADHRLRVRPSEVGQFASDLAVELGASQALKVLKAGDATQKWIAAVARDLKAHAGKCVVTAGVRQPAAVHAIAYQINQALGNIGATVTFTKPVFEAATPLAEFATELSQGRVTTLLILGGNPAFTAPVDLNFVEGIRKVGNSYYLGLESDETAALCKWQLPMAHELETWGDARAIDGTASIQQPMVRPIWGGRSAIEIVAQFASDDHKAKKGYEVVRAQWKDLDEKAWRKALHDGVVAGTAYPEVKATLDAKAVPSIKAAAADGYEVVFLESASLSDGRYANNAWLQEAPEPMTKLVWDNAAWISPATAKKEGIETGQIIEIDLGGKKIAIAAMVAPGYADGVIGLALGYGREKAGRVARAGKEPVGVNAYKIRSSTAWNFAGGARITKTLRKHDIVTTQEHHTMEEPTLAGRKGKHRPVVREATAAEYKATPDFAEHMDPHIPQFDDLQGYHDYSKGNQWGMAIDLNACVGCNACLIACNAENNIPVVGKQQVKNGREMHWIRMDRYYTGSEEDPQAVMQPIQCQQCEAAPCENVCPVAATVHSPEGLNEMAYNRCVGTRYCANNCPYKVRRFNYLNWHKQDRVGTTPERALQHNPDVTVRMRGVVEKCTYCVQRIQEKKIQAKTEGRRPLKDLEILTACQQTCPAEAITFGNINDPESAVSKAKKQPRNYVLLKEVNTKPRTTFLARLRNPNPELEAPKPAGAHGAGGHSAAPHGAGH